MSSFFEELVGSVAPEVAQQLSSQLGIDRDQASQILPQVAPLILGGLKRQMEQRGGAPRLDHILNKYGNDGVLDDIGGALQNMANKQNADPGLGGLLGDSGEQATNMLAQNFSLDMNTARKIIPMLAPIILGVLTRTRDTGGAGSKGVADWIDQNGDGNILDDVAGLLTRGLSGMQDSQSAGSGLLGDLLGAVLGGRKR
jgi:hypothetical protein